MSTAPQPGVGNNAIRIRRALASDVNAIRDLERAAGVVFATVGLDQIAADDPPSAATLTDAVASGHVLVALAEPVPSTATEEQIVGWALWEPDGPTAHLEQVSVHPDWSGRRIGRRLITAVDAAAAATGAQALTLTTFRDVVWNAPLYRRYGFVDLPESDWGPALQQRWLDEQAAGLDVAPRIAMMRPINTL
ncbi:MAG: GNAT family N-acetyltransferase [Actinomycetota bacterium]